MIFRSAPRRPNKKHTQIPSLHVTVFALASGLACPRRSGTVEHTQHPSIGFAHCTGQAAHTHLHATHATSHAHTWKMEGAQAPRTQLGKMPRPHSGGPSRTPSPKQARREHRRARIWIDAARERPRASCRTRWAHHSPKCLPAPSMRVVGACASPMSRASHRPLDTYYALLTPSLRPPTCSRA